MQQTQFTRLDLDSLAYDIHEYNCQAGWWTPEDYAAEGKEKATIASSKLCLAHSELSEALEGIRKNSMDDHLKHRRMVEVELADAIIRILDLGAFLKLNVGAALYEKLEYNTKRADHKIENRSQDGGKTI